MEARRTTSEDDNELGALIQEHRATVAALQGRIVVLEDRVARLETENGHLRRRNASLEKRNAKLEKRNASLEKRNAKLRKRVGQLEKQLAQAQRNSSNSSKPPSSDIVKRAKDAGESEHAGKRKRGAQPGHAKHERAPFPPEAVTDPHEYTLDHCPTCGATVIPASQAPKILQQLEIKDDPIERHEHRSYAFWCENCRTIHYAAIPADVEKAGLAGPRLTALIAYMKGACHASFSTIRKFLRDVVGITISRGQLAKIVRKASDALAAPYDEILQQVPCEARLNVDETGHKDNGERFWTWCFRADLYVLFKIDKSRGSKVLIDVLGEEFNGVLGCDYFSAYRKFMRDFGVEVQFCLAHLIRDVKFLTSLRDGPTQAYGERLLEALRALFHVIHRREEMTTSRFEEELQRQREKTLAIALSEVPSGKEAQNLANRFRKHGDAYFRFITTPGIDPTNNIAERAIRFVVIDRLVTQGTRGVNGRNWCERIWTVLATCATQNRSAFDYLVDAVNAYFRGEPAPSLVHAGT